MADTPIDAVEIKCTLSDTSLDLAMMSLHLGDPDRKRTVWFFDSIDSTQQGPRLFHAAIILRLRRKKDGPGESTLKLRPARAELLIGDFRAGAGHFGDRYSVEWDWAHDKEQWTYGDDRKFLEPEPRLVTRDPDEGWT